MRSNHLSYLAIISSELESTQGTFGLQIYNFLGLLQRVLNHELIPAFLYIREASIREMHLWKVV